MVKIDETYFDNDLEEELQETTPAEREEYVTVSEPKPLLADLLEEESEDEALDEIETIDESMVMEPVSPKELEDDNVEEKIEEVGSEEEEEFPEDSEKPHRSHSNRGLWYWLGGDVLEQPAFRKYIPAFIAILLMGLIHITSNYQIISKRRQIDKLETRVKDLTYKHMESVSELTRRSIGGNFEQQLKAMGSDLEAPSQQTIVLYRNAKKK